jgi:hygromycin-B 4-O-kinase
MRKPALDGIDLAQFTETLVPGASNPHPMAEGLRCRAFGIEAGSERYVLRIASDDRGFGKDAYAARTFRGLPVPEVVAMGDLGEHAYCLTRRLPGATVNRLSEPELPPVVQALDAMLTKIRSVDVTGSAGFGRFDGSGAGAFPTWRDYLLDPAEAIRAGDRAFVPAGLAEALHRYVIDRVDDCPEIRCVFHGDFGSDNVLTDGQAITGVLDWELAGYGDPLHDVAGMLLWDGTQPCMTAQGEHLRRVYGSDPVRWRRIDCYRARLCLAELAWSDERSARWIVGVAQKLLSTP